MKKNKALTAAFSVFALTMVSMCAIGGTFAKYTTHDDATDTATVAKWGVTVTAESYEVATDIGGSTQDTHISASGSADNVKVAPGSEGKLVYVDVEGTPEVALTINHDATVVVSDGWEDENGAFYFPIAFKVNNVAVTGTFDSKEAVQNALTAAIEAIGKTDAVLTEISAGTELGSTYDLTVTWSWAFDGDDDADTYLASQGTMPTFSVSVTSTATQVD